MKRDYVKQVKDFYRKIKHLPKDYVITQKDIDAEKACNYWYVRVVACYMSSTIEEVISILVS